MKSSKVTLGWLCEARGLQENDWGHLRAHCYMCWDLTCHQRKKHVLVVQKLASNSGH